MSLKRKASTLDEPVIYNHATNGSPAGAGSNTTSPTSSTSSFSPASHDYPYCRDAWNVGFVPYMNSRTMKRYRDNRPNQGQIHDHTLKKLYEAQRLHLDESMPLSEVLSEEGGEGAEQPMYEDIDVMDDILALPVTASSGMESLKQKTLESFFNIRQSAPAQRDPVAS